MHIYKRGNFIIFVIIFLLSNIYSCLYYSICYADFVEDIEPNEPIIFRTNDNTIKIITSESEIEKYEKDPIGTQRVIKVNKDHVVVHRFYKLWEGTCQHVAHDEWIEYKIYNNGDDVESGSSCITYHQFPEESYDPNNHTWGEWKLVETKESTDTEEGFKKYERSCTRGKGYWASRGECGAKEYKVESINNQDLSVQLEEPVSSVAEGDKVLVGVNIKSSYDRELTNIPFKWEITKKGGTAVAATFTGHSNIAGGKIEKIPAKGELILYASFNMPDSDVNIRFEINKDGTNPPETELENNVLETTITSALSINAVGDFNLDYNVLSKKVSFSLAGGKDIIARLSAPRGNLSGYAWGALNIYNKSTDLFRGLNDRVLFVNEPAGTIIKNPIINTTIHRKDATFDSSTNRYDNPLESKWLDGPTSKTVSGKVSFGGTAYADYKYTVTKTNEDGTTYPETETRTTSAAFNSGTDTRTITTKIYNGTPTIPAKTFENKIDYNSANYLQKSLFWTSEPYKFDVVRWMCYQDVDDSLYGWTAVPGRYKRTFTQQNSGILKWTPSSTMKDDYKRSREAARSMDYRKSEYDKAVFASDMKFKNVDYPIKAGYYFNPTGTYTFTVETVTYKTTKDETKDHKDLVQAAIDSFRYESDLMYINSKKEPVNLQNEPIYKNGKNYERCLAALTAKDPTGVDGVEMLKVEKTGYSKEWEEIKHSEKSGEFTHEYLKEILEGYEESGTVASKDKYKYREYIKDGQNLYKITEKTTVTIKINPDNRNMYTYINMPDGKYRIAAWIGDIKLSDTSNAYKTLGAIKGIYNFDVIEVEVNGTLYDDQNALIGN
ncbi:MAG: hypothetical protein BWY74_03163 [Firmicutes bacterium ADurb.Bin419]|nr:MAG: hypothetical protein BWY74_03163 [Firmicutes bacterium ADurb.Bin419]